MKKEEAIAFLRLIRNYLPEEYKKKLSELIKYVENDMNLEGNFFGT